ncbi:MAG: hypothetical protein JSR82_12990 [Verrucomicrobia bacterium]|nr:hypothetical protein [Verrucomicrobiota bacterium]
MIPLFEFSEFLEAGIFQRVSAVDDEPDIVRQPRGDLRDHIAAQKVGHGLALAGRGRGRDRASKNLRKTKAAADLF